jgi:hypothetical protein
MDRRIIAQLFDSIDMVSSMDTTAEEAETTRISTTSRSNNNTSAIISSISSSNLGSKVSVDAGGSEGVDASSELTAAAMGGNIRGAVEGVVGGVGKKRRDAHVGSVTGKHNNGYVVLIVATNK